MKSLKLIVLWPDEGLECKFKNPRFLFEGSRFFFKSGMLLFLAEYNFTPKSESVPGYSVPEGVTDQQVFILRSVSEASMCTLVWILTRRRQAGEKHTLKSLGKNSGEYMQKSIHFFTARQ